MIIIVAVMLVAILALLAYTIDLGGARQAQQQAQTAADAGALAAADAIGTGTSSPGATTAGQSMASTNDPGSAPTVTVSGQTATVAVSQYAQNRFAGGIGSSGQRVSARAVAVAHSTALSSMSSAIFAGSTTCTGTGLALTSSNVNITGAVISNGSMNENGLSGRISGSQSYGCNFTENANPAFSVTGATSQGSTANPYPLDYRTAYPNPCTAANTNTVLTVVVLVLPLNGISCYSQPITVSGVLSGSGTIIAPSITMLTSIGTFTPYWHNLDFWATSGNLTFAGALLSGGTVFAPSGTITIIASAAAVTGFVEGNQVAIEANPNFTLIGNGAAPVTSGSGSALTG